MSARKRFKRIYAMLLSGVMALSTFAGNMPITAQAATEKAHVSYDKVYQYSDDGLGTFFTRHYSASFGDVSGTAYCLSPSKFPPGNGNYSVSKVKASTALAKVLYYGGKYSEKADSNYFDSDSYKNVLKNHNYSKLSDSGEFVIVHTAAAKADGSDDWDSGLNEKGRTIVNNFLNWLDKQEAVPDSDVWFSFDGEETNNIDGRDSAPEVSGLSKYNLDKTSDRWSKGFSIRCAEAQTITMTLPDDVRLVTAADGKVTSVSGYGATVKNLNENATKTSCYLLYRGTGKSSTIKIKGSTLTKEYSAYRLTKTGASSSTQELAMITAATDNSSASLKVRWTDNKGKFGIVKTEEKTGYALKGIVYGLYKDKACTNLVAKFPATNASGRSELDNISVTQNYYYVKEISAVSGIAISKDVYKVEPVDVDDQIDWKNAGEDNSALFATDDYQYGSAEIYKFDAENKNINPQGAADLRTAKYALYASQDIYWPGTDKLYAKKGQKLKEEAIGNDFKIIFKDLPVGNYYVQETYAAKGYTIDSKQYPITVTPNNLYGQTIDTKSVESYEEVKKANVTLYKFRESEDSKQEIKTPLAGITFTITSKTNGKQWKIVTNKDGMASTKVSYADEYKKDGGVLPYDTYRIEETSGTPAGVKPIELFEVTLREDDDDKVKNVDYTWIVENKNVTSPVSVLKVDSTTGKTIPLAGTTFRLLDSNKKVVTMTTHYPNTQKLEAFQTDENGQFTFPEALKAGTYYLEEVNAPHGYLKGEMISFKIEKMSDWENPLVVTYKDAPAMGKISLKKTEEGEEKALAGAEYSVTAMEDIVTEDGTIRAKKGEVVDTLITDAQGNASSKDLYLGNYNVVETKAPAGYALDDTNYLVTLEYEGQDVPVVESSLDVTDKPTELKLLKVKSGTNDALKGVTFTIWNKAMGEDEVDTDIAYKESFTTDEYGLIDIKYLAPGIYCVQETATLPGYILDGTVHEIEVDENGRINGQASFELKVNNDYTKLHVSKTDITGKDEISGASMEILDKNGKVLYHWISNGEEHVIEAIPAGDYTLREISAPDGYVTAEDVVFTVADTGEVQTVSMKDDVTKVQISKTDITGKKELPGAALTITDQAGNDIASWVSEDKPHYIEKLPAGHYTLYETSAPDGYVTAESVAFDVKDTGDIQKVVMKDDVTKVQISKTDITGKDEVPGAKLEIIDESGDTVASWTSGDKPYYIEKLPIGDYTLREISAPDGYVTAEDVAFTVADTGDIQKVVMKDDVTKVQISKTDITGKKELAGAKLQIMDQNGKILDSWTSGKKPHYIEKLPVGKYTLKEVTAPEGYEIAEDVSFTVKDTAEIQKVTMKDKASPSKGKKVKIVKTGDMDFRGLAIMCSAALCAAGIILVTRKVKKNR